MRRVVLLVAAGLLLSDGPAAAATPFGSRDVPAASKQTSWSPDGRWIAYIRSDSNELVLISPDGSSERVVGEARAPFDAEWSPTGRRIAWQTFSPPQLNVADLETSSVKAIPGYGFHFDWSPDGERIAHIDILQGDRRPLYVSSWDGSNRLELPTGVRTHQVFEWSPDGREIAYERSTGCGHEMVIEAIRPDGSGRRTIAQGAQGPWAPRWSPAGTHIAYRAICEQRVRVVERMGVNDRDVGDEGRASSLSWSPAGRWLALVRVYNWLDLIDTESGARHRFRFEQSRVSWSPRGDEIAYTRDGSVIVGSIDGSERVVATGHGADWSPAGEISFLRAPYQGPTEFARCEEQIFVVEAHGRNERPVSPCLLTGGGYRDRIAGTSGPDRAYGLGGPDHVHGEAGNDRVYGGAGHDRLFGGPGEDVIAGDRGNDKLSARDGQRDVVRCGRGRDVVFADALDSVASDCEVVRRA